MTRRALVVTHGGREEAVHATAEAVRELEAAGIEPVHDGGDHHSDVHAVDLAGVEFTIVLGGDGTILRAAEITRDAGIPVLGVNLGHVGFLAESEREDVAEAVRRMADGDYEVEERGTLEVRAMLPGEPEPVLASWALNEATVEKGDRDRMIEVVVEVDGRPLSSFGCDGVVMSTSTGSTAYAFSAGGPVVWPDVDGMILVPVSAHALFARPLVVGPRSVLAVEVLARSTSAGVVRCDGRRRFDLPVGARVEVRRSDVPVRLARLSRAPFADRLVSKFSLPVEGWRGRAAAVLAGPAPAAARGSHDGTAAAVAGPPGASAGAAGAAGSDGSGAPDAVGAGGLP